MKPNIIIGIVIALLVVGGVGYYAFNNQSQTETIVNDDNAVMEEKVQIEPGDNKMIEGYTGTVIAGSISPYLAFTQTDYEKALSENKIIFLDFYANWCPICRAEAPDIQAGFDQLNDENIIGFRVNYNDTDTDDAEKALAIQYGITYQHTKVIIKDGQEILKNGEQWDTERFLKEISQIN